MKVNLRGAQRIPKSLHRQRPVPETSTSVAFFFFNDIRIWEFPALKIELPFLTKGCLFFTSPKGTYNIFLRIFFIRASGFKISVFDKFIQAQVYFHFFSE